MLVLTGKEEKEEKKIRTKHSYSKLWLWSSL